MQQEAGDLFIEKLLAEAGLADLPADYKQEYIAKLQELLNRRVGLIILENLSEADATAFTDILNSTPAKSANELQAFFSDKIPDLETKIKDGLTAFTAEFLFNVNKSKI